ncbi:putative quinol monooxygenase [Maridesulfovibrio sp.]|uniref:putative quinol monooxygenase n=1 Tax=Maridesulfovibrio sp. TaxID=2795000 RepID=UPI003BABDBD7
MPKHLVFYVEFNVKPECIEKFLKGATVVIEAMSKEDSFVTAYLHRDANDTNKFTLYERWTEASMDDFMRNQLQGKSYRDEYEEYLPDLLTSPRTFAVLDPIGEWQS